MDNRPVFTIITLCYRRLAFLQEALAAMFRQTYPFIEIVIVDNGSIPEVYQYITELEQKDKRVKLVHFKENQFRDDDPGHLIKVCFNAALQAATGEFIFYQSDDDRMADDYVEKMVALFEANPACTSAAGYVKDMDATGQLLPEGTRSTNFRPRYMPGHLLALSTLSETYPRTLFSAPGCIFTFRRQELIQNGGFHACVEDSQMYGIVPFGISGFDETAVFCWRRHEGQLNRSMSAHGYVGFDATLDFLQEWQIQKRWEIFGTDMAKYVVQRITENIYRSAASWFVVNFYNFRLQASLSLLLQCGHSFYFWRNLPILFWKERRQFWYFLKEKIPSLKSVKLGRG